MLNEDDDLFLEADMHTEVQNLIEQTLLTNECCNVDEYLNDDVPTCMEAESDSCEADFFEELGQKDRKNNKRNSR